MAIQWLRKGFFFPFICGILYYDVHIHVTKSYQTYKCGY